ncbi:MAG: hypothetical protein KAH32_06985, partial [Chlamydiia bacterium]|nr:hypothetical protein [Chlamydiia bacterium]
KKANIMSRTDEQDYIAYGTPAYWKDMNEALTRLRQNKDFIKVIQQGYLGDTTLALVTQLTTLNLVDNTNRPKVFESILASSNLMSHFLLIENLATRPEVPMIKEPSVEETSLTEMKKRVKKIKNKK